MPTLAPDALTRFSAGQQSARDILSGDSRYSCLVGGTRSGKTFLIVRNIIIRALKGPGSRHLCARFRFNAAKASLARDTIPAVLRICFPELPVKEHRGDAYFFEIANGSEIHVAGLDDKERVEKILGTEFATVFLNEASQIAYASALIAWTRLAQVVPGLKQRGYVDLNPVGKAHWTNRLFGQHIDPVSGQALPDPENYQRAFLNPVDNAHNLSSEFLRSLENMPERQRKRFYEGVYVDEVDGALWTIELIETTRVEPADIPVSQRAQVVVAVDPSGASGREDLGADEIGIVVACKGLNGHAYILDDRSLLAGPIGWARAAVQAYHAYSADCIVAEANFGGEMVRQTIKSVDPNVPVRLVTASRGKAVRAEPISALFGEMRDGVVERGHAHIVGRMPKLEEQLCAFATNGYQGSDSPDHADAAIWALTHLMLAPTNDGIIEFYRQQAEAQAAAGPPKQPRIGPAEPEGRLVAMLAPEGASTAYGLSGRRYDVVAGRIEVEEGDVAPLRVSGFREAAHA